MGKLRIHCVFRSFTFRSIHPILAGGMTLAENIVETGLLAGIEKQPNSFGDSLINQNDNIRPVI